MFSKTILRTTSISNHFAHLIRRISLPAQQVKHIYQNTMENHFTCPTLGISLPSQHVEHLHQIIIRSLHMINIGSFSIHDIMWSHTETTNPIIVKNPSTYMNLVATCHHKMVWGILNLIQWVGQSTLKAPLLFITSIKINKFRKICIFFRTETRSRYANPKHTH